MTTLVVLSVALSVLLVSSCRHDKVRAHHDDEARFAQLDSMMRTIGSIDSLEALARQSHEQNDCLGEMLALKYKGEKLRGKSRFIEAITADNRALALANSMCDTIEICSMQTYLGEDYRRLGNLSQANGHYLQVLKLCDAHSDNDCVDILKAEAHALNGIGNIEMDMGDYVTADSVLREALMRQIRLGSDLGMAVNYGALGRLKSDLGDLDSAWYYQRKALECNQLAGNNVGVAMTHLHFGELHQADNRFSHALEEYRLAYDMLEQEGDIWHWLDACLALARVHILLGEEDKAHEYLDKAEVESHRIGSKEYQAESHLIHYEFSLLKGNSNEALQHYVRGVELMDSIYGRQKSEEMRSQRMEFQNHRMSGEVDVLNRDITQLKRMRNVQTVLLILLLTMAGAIIAALVYAVRTRMRTQRLMRQVEETRSLFFTNVVHQLRTPLSAIMGSIDSIMTKASENVNNNVYTDSQQENARILERQGKNLLDLVDRILEVGSVRSAITELDWRTSDVVTFMHMLVDSFHDRCVERHIELTYASLEDSVEMDFVPRYLTTIVSSLLENAINYCSDYGKITVTTNVSDGKLVIRVADNGMGISKEDLPHVFEPFYRSAVAEAMVEGVGIGLTVVRDMTMALGGTVAVDSMMDHGSVFTVKLPCRHYSGVKQLIEGNVKDLIGISQHRHTTSKALTVPDEASRSGELPVVLIVEDHVDVARLVGLVLGNRYQVHYATDGEQGLAKAIELVPALIITDVKMPLMDGVELCRHLRRMPRLCHIPVIILSARNADADRVRGIKAGADAYLVKPFVSEELLTWVDSLLENRKRLRACYTACEQPEPFQNDPVLTDATEADDGTRFLEDFAREVDKYFTSGRKIDFDKMALAFRMGESQMRRKIQDLTGKNVLAYIIQLRMEKAMRLLQNSPADTLIGDIALQCGFQDVAYFSRVFRQHYGMTPTQARNANK